MAAPPAAGITETIKANRVFKEFIGYIARSDANHDFGGDGTNGFQYNGTTANNINRGLYGVTNIDKTNEKGSMWNVLIELIGNNQADKERALDSFLDSLPDSAFSPEFNVGFRDINTPTNSSTPLHKYVARRINMRPLLIGTEITGEELMNACGLQGGGALIIDFNHNGFLEKLRTSETVPTEPIYVITNPQTMNDAAGKTKYNDELVNNRILKSIIDRRDKLTTYSTWSNTDMDINNLFLTSYQLEVTPIILVKNIMGKLHKLSVNNTVINVQVATKPKSVIKDAKVNNSKGEIWKKVSSIFRFFNTRHFEVNEGLQRKRNGDWGQGLSCLTLDGGEYYESNLTTLLELIFNLDNVYFVTHDYIAAAYALLIGVNVIFLAAESILRGVPKRAYIFKNTNYMGNTEEYMLDQLNAINNSTNKHAIVHQKDNLITYNAKRNQILTQYTDGLDTEIARLDGLIRSGGLKNPNTLKTTCILIFENAYYYQQIKQTSPDPRKIITELENTPVPVLAAAYIKPLYDAFCTAKNINRLYDNTDHGPQEIINGIRKSNIYLSLKHWTYTKELRTTFSMPKRLGVKVGAGSTGNQDKFAFVPFLATCDNAIKNKIVRVFRALLTKLEGPQFIEGRESGSIYQHALLSFKILCETVCVFLAENEVAGDPELFKTVAETSDKTTFIYVNNLLSETRTVEENTEANTKTTHLTNSEKTNIANELRLGLEVDQVDTNANAETTLQDGGFFRGQAVPRILNHNSIKESTHVMLTAHLILISQENIEFIRNYCRRRGPQHAAVVVNEAQDALENIRVTGGGNTPVATTNTLFSTGLPIYTVLEGLRVAIPELNNHPDYEDYITYYLMLESMNDTLKIQSSPVTGFALREILLTFISIPIGRDIIKTLFSELGPEYNLFPYIATTTSAYVCGSFVEYDEGKPEVIELATLVMQSQPVKDYIAAVIETYKTKDRGEFYIDGKHNLQNFMNKVNRLQDSIGKEILGKELKSIARQLQEKGITPKNIQRFIMANTRKANSRTVSKRLLNNKPNRATARQTISVAGKRKTQRKRKN